jgi:mannose-6-phosphate isomerase-like protein (cupin superfamily)
MIQIVLQSYNFVSFLKKNSIQLTQTNKHMHYRLTLAQMLNSLDPPAGKTFEVGFQHGSMSIELYRPHLQDLQKPHLQDEIYVVAAGRGIFYRAGERVPFGPADVLFVPAGMEHHFEDFTSDLAVWVIFYGPEGGESNQTQQS